MCFVSRYVLGKVGELYDRNIVKGCLGDDDLDGPFFMQKNKIKRIKSIEKIEI